MGAVPFTCECLFRETCRFVDTRNDIQDISDGVSLPLAVCMHGRRSSPGRHGYPDDEVLPGWVSSWSAVALLKPVEELHVADRVCAMMSCMKIDALCPDRAFVGAETLCITNFEPRIHRCSVAFSP